MPNQISSQQFNNLQNMVSQGNFNGFYSYMQSQGYQYAGLAQAVLNADFPNGTTALAFVQQTAQKQGNTLSDQEISQIKQQMAQGYLDTLKSEQLDKQGIITRDVNSAEAWAFHNDVFAKHDLPQDAWTLNTPFQMFGDNVTGREQFWQSLLANQSIGDSLLGGGDRANAMMWAIGQFSGDPQVKAQAKDWLDRVNSTTGFVEGLRFWLDGTMDQMKDFINNLGVPGLQMNSIDFNVNIAQGRDINKLADQLAELDIRKSSTMVAGGDETAVAQALQNAIDRQNLVSAWTQKLVDLQAPSQGDSTGIQATWTLADGSYGSDEFNVDGSGVVNTYDAATGVYGYDVVNADGSFTDYNTTYDAGGGYQQSWTASDGSSGQNNLAEDGSTLTSRTNADGSSTTSTFDATTQVHGYDAVATDGSSTHYDTTYGANGSYQQSWTASDGSSGQNNLAEDGSTLTSTVKADGSSTTSTFDAATQMHGYDAVATDGSSTHYDTAYGANGSYQQSWTASDGRHGENDRADNGSTLTQTVNADGSSTTNTQDAATGVYKVDTVDAHGSSSGYAQNPDGSYSTYAQDGGGNRQSESFDANGQLMGSSITSQQDGFARTDNYDASGQLTDYTFSFPNGAIAGGPETDTYAPDGKRLSDTWTDPYGDNHGYDTFNADGSSSGATYIVGGGSSTYTRAADGSSLTNTFDSSGALTGYSTFAPLADGSSRADSYDASGVRLSDSWQNVDGTHGYDNFNPQDGSSSGASYSADGSFQTYVLSADGSTQTNNFNANGNEISDSWQNADGTHGSDTFNAGGSVDRLAFSADGSYVETFAGSDGSTQTNNFGADGVETSDSWQQADGSHGSDTFNADGTSSGTSYDFFGDYSTYTKTADGSSVTDNYGVSGQLLGSTTYTINADGTTETANFDPTGGLTGFVDKDAAGRITSDLSTNGNSTERDAFTYGANGSSEEISTVEVAGAPFSSTDTITQADGSDTRTSSFADGRAETFSFDAATGESIDRLTAADGSYSAYDNIASTDGSYNDYSYASDGTHTRAVYDAATGELTRNSGDASGNTSIYDQKADGSTSSSASYVDPITGIAVLDAYNVGGGTTEHQRRETLPDGSYVGYDSIVNVNGSYNDYSYSNDGTHTIYTRNSYDAIAGTHEQQGHYYIGERSFDYDYVTEANRSRHGDESSSNGSHDHSTFNSATGESTDSGTTVDGITGSSLTFDYVVEADGSYDKSTSNSEGAYNHSTFNGASGTHESVGGNSDGTYDFVDYAEGSYSHSQLSADGDSNLDVFDAPTDTLTRSGVVDVLTESGAIVDQAFVSVSHP